MKWYVYRHNINAGKIEKFNVFDHVSFTKEVRELAQKNFDRDTFSEELRHIAMYYFWSRCEHEVIITSWPPRVNKEEFERLASEDIKYSTYVNLTVGEKIDIYDQLQMNWDAFVNYVWGCRSAGSAIG